MFVYAVKSSKVRVIALALVLVAALLALFFLVRGNHKPTAGSTVRRDAGTAEERMAFLAQYGWEAEPEPLEVSEVIIPAEFDDNYKKYNEIQKKQNFDLEPFAGKRVKRWTYAIKNYPGYESRPGVVQVNLLVDKGQGLVEKGGVIIGGDVCSLELKGFLHGFEFPKERPAVAATTLPQLSTTAISATQ